MLSAFTALVNGHVDVDGLSAPASFPRSIVKTCSDELFVALRAENVDFGLLTNVTTGRTKYHFTSFDALQAALKVARRLEAKHAPKAVTP